AAYQLTEGQLNEWDNQIHCLKRFDKYKKFLALDGNVFFKDALQNSNIYKDQEKAKPVLSKLNDLQKLLPDKIKPASPFYAVLMMDGDSLGKQMSVKDKQENITQGLKDFTDSVPNLVEKHSGFLIYAGGDDVLAVLPLEDALSCALAVRQSYECVFAKQNLGKTEKKQVFTSISAAVLFAHINMPLKNVLKEAHQLLDNVAKDKYGRDSLAVSVWKPGGKVLEWARSWDKAVENKQLVIERLAKQFATDDESGQFSNRFLYKIRERFELLNPPLDPHDETKKLPPVLSDAQAIDLMAAEYFSSGLCELLKIDEKKATHAEKMSHAKTIVAPLLEQCRPIYRKLDMNTATFESSTDVLVDAALLIRFLAQHGVNL
ncbi:type III-B CRISPR-associated protein Cas10/Cmr2, partial [Patescibacteria group bacterium]